MLLIRIMAQKDWGESIVLDEEPSGSTPQKKFKNKSKTKSKTKSKIEPKSKTKSKVADKVPRKESSAWKKQKKMFERSKTRVKILGIIIILFIIFAVVLGYIYFYQVDTDGDGILDIVDDDDDNDGMPDDWEEQFGLNPKDSSDAKRDKDNDGLKNREEYDFKSNPEKGDTDSDAVNDYDECKIHHSLPDDPDSDDDVMPDGWEVKYALDPMNNDADLDSDNDGYDSNRNDHLDEIEQYTNLEEFLNNTNPKMNDSDSDGMTDGWEIHFRYKTYLLKIELKKYNPPGKRDYNYTFDPNDPRDAQEDIDVDTTRTINRDGLTNLQEFNFGTDPTRPDSDGDNLTDYEEVTQKITDPLKPDTDDDKLWDGWEIKYGGEDVGLNPNSNDTDEDSLPDTFEDLDNDTFLTSFLYNLVEFNLGTSPISNDTDSDGLLDGWEEYYGLNPLEHNHEIDTDSDLLSDRAEFENGTEPNNQDTDLDGLTDGEELLIGFPGLLVNGSYESDATKPHYFTNPLSNDTDNDNILDGEEVAADGGEDRYVSNATNSDTDADGISDFEEVEVGEDGFSTDPTNSDTDSDGLTDKEEIDSVYGYNTRPTIADLDDDGLLDGEEILTDFYPFTPEINNTDPMDNDTDDDGMEDGWEAHFGFADRNLLETLIRNYDQRYKRTNYYSILKNNENIPGVWLVNPLDPGDKFEDPDFDWYDDDGDGIIDALEEFKNLEEFSRKTNPLAWDSDLDHMSDGWEVTYGLNPVENDANLDGDLDGIHYWVDGIKYEDTFTNLEEYLMGEDSNGDGIIDSNTTDPDNFDTDSDGESDYHEIWFGDDDGDGLVNGWELIFNGTPLDVGGFNPKNPMRGYFDPTKPDSDGNGKNDSDEDYDVDQYTNLREQFTSGINDINDIKASPGCSDPTDYAMTPVSIKKRGSRSSFSLDQDQETKVQINYKLVEFHARHDYVWSTQLFNSILESVANYFILDQITIKSLHHRYISIWNI